MGILDFFKKRPKAALPARSSGTRRYLPPRDLNGDPVMNFGGRMDRVPTSLGQIQGAARHLVHTNPNAQRATSVLVEQTIGTGIRYAFSGAPGYDSDFFSWANDPELCDYEGNQDIYGIQASFCLSIVEAGEGIIILRDGKAKDNYLPKLQVVDPNFLEENATPKYKSNRVISGVEVGPTGKVVGYHFGFDSGTGERWNEFAYADHVIHAFERRWPGQLRGIPRGVQVLAKVEALESFIVAALAKSRVEACFGVAIVRPPSMDDNQSNPLFEQLTEVQQDGDKFEQIAGLNPGGVFDVQAGSDIKTISPTSIGGYDAYIRIHREDIASGYGVPYAWMTSDISKANFASSKVALINFYSSVDFFRKHVLSTPFKRIEKFFRASHELKNAVDLSYLDVTMIPPRRNHLEPAKEIAERMQKMAAGLLSHRMAIYEEGEDPDVVIAEIVRERKSYADKGLVFAYGATTVGELAAQEAEDDAAAAAEEAVAQIEDRSKNNRPDDF